MNKKQLDNLSFYLSVFGIISLIFLAIGLHNMENYTDWLLFTITSIVCGILVGFIIFRLICIRIPEAKSYKSVKGYGFLSQLIFAFMLISFGSLRLINESKITKTDCKPYTIIQMAKSGSRRPSYYIFIDKGNGKERLSFGKAFYEMHHIGDTIDLCYQKGILGFTFCKIKSKK